VILSSKEISCGSSFLEPRITATSHRIGDRLCRCPAFDDLLESRPYSSSELEKIILLRPAPVGRCRRRSVFFICLISSWRFARSPLFQRGKWAFGSTPPLFSSATPSSTSRMTLPPFKSLLLFYQEQKPISYRAGPALYSVMADSDPLLRLRRIERLLRRLFAYREFEQGTLLYDEKTFPPVLILAFRRLCVGFASGPRNFAWRGLFFDPFSFERPQFCLSPGCKLSGIFSPSNRLLVLQSGRFLFFLERARKNTASALPFRPEALKAKEDVSYYLLSWFLR
jgi:hypothetical protein